MKYFLCLLSIIFCSCTQSTITHDDAYLQKLAAAYQETKVDNDMQKELDALEIYLDEAIRQNNKTEENYIRGQKLVCYQSYDEYEKFYAEVKTQAKYFREQKNWKDYYMVFRLEIDGLVIQNRVESALRKAQIMYDEAQKEQRMEGIGAAAFCIGYIYVTSDRYQEAKMYLLKALEIFKKTNNTNMLIGCYDYIPDNLANLEEYEAAIFYNQQYEQFILSLEKRDRDQNLVSDYSVMRANCYYSYVYAYYQLNNIEKAEYYYNKQCECTGQEQARPNYINQSTRSFILRMKGDTQNFLLLTDSLIDEYRGTGNTSSLLSDLNAKAEVLMEINEHKEAAQVYQTIISLKDSLSKQDMGARLDDLRSIYDLDRITAEKEKNQLYAIIGFSVCFFLIVLLILYVRYSNHLKEKNRNLFNRIQELARLEKEQQRIEREEISRLEEQREIKIVLSDDAPADPSREELLIKRLRVWLNTDHRFAESDINRKQMAEYLGTNEKYLADAIRNQCDGQTVSDFINMLRLSYARELLSGKPEMTIEAVAMEAGLNTRTTLFRLFRKHYGMSPSEFRTLLKQGE